MKVKENKENKGYRTHVKCSFENKIKNFFEKILMKV